MRLELATPPRVPLQQGPPSPRTCMNGGRLNDDNTSIKKTTAIREGGSERCSDPSGTRYRRRAGAG